MDMNKMFLKMNCHNRRRFMDTRFEELKKELFMQGLDSVEEFLGFEISKIRRRRS